MQDKQSIAKLWVNHASMTSDPSCHVAYLLNGHQLGADEHPQVWTKSLPKNLKHDHKALVNHWHGIYDKFCEQRAAPDGMVRHNAKVTARQFVINLPNDMDDSQVHKIAKSVLRDFPRHIPVMMTLHLTSNSGAQHAHLQGLFSYRNGGYGRIQDKFRLSITNQMKATVAQQCERMGYHVDHGTPGSINNKQRSWLYAQGSAEQRRNPRFMRSIADQAISEQIRTYCLKQAEAMESRMHKSTTLPYSNDVLYQLMSICNRQTSHGNSPQPDRPTGVMPVTHEQLELKYRKELQWKRTKKITRIFFT